MFVTWWSERPRRGAAGVPPSCSVSSATYRSCSGCCRRGAWSLTRPVVQGPWQGGRTHTVNMSGKEIAANLTQMEQTWQLEIKTSCEYDRKLHRHCFQPLSGSDGAQLMASYAVLFSAGNCCWWTFYSRMFFSTCTFQFLPLLLCWFVAFIEYVEAPECYFCLSGEFRVRLMFDLTQMNNMLIKSAEELFVLVCVCHVAGGSDEGPWNLVRIIFR